ncbi:ABC transporter ATP-binding protein [Halobacteriales archaeon QS_9_70_65]|nr:MAG: ABC transporter ATP-binding protein [Halobacteriales archaeon QS_9_70_65]
MTDAASDADADDAASANADAGDVVLRVENLRKEFGGLVAVDDASFDVERGTITALIGPNGAGKSTVFNLVSGFYEPDAGRVEVDGVDVTGLEPYEVADHGLIRTFQTPRKLEGMTVREAMLVGPQDQPGESFLTLFTAPGAVAAAEKRNLADAERLLEPEILLLDEPAAGVNPTLRAELAAQIRRLNEAGTTCLLIEHDMEFVMELADPVVVLDQGGVLTQGSPEAVRADDRVVEAYLGGGA